MAEEDAKPNADRLREYRQSNCESLEQMVFSAAPIYDDLETVELADSLSCFSSWPGERRSAGRESAGRQVAAGRAAELVRGTKLKDVAVRRELAKGGTRRSARRTTR